MKIIEISNLVKEFKIIKRKKGLLGALQNLISNKYEIIKAVNEINFSVDQGEILGFIGPNGAGKSTTIKMLVGILHPTSGKVFVDGIDPHKKRKENAKKIGVVFGQRTQLWWDIPVRETYNLLKTMYDVPSKDFKERLNFFYDLLDMRGFVNKPTRLLSLGQRMRADICAALIHNPKILFLDEPTIGLDTAIKEKIRKFIKEINQEFKTTIILTTHDISDIEKLSTRIIIIDKGDIIYQGELNELKNIYDSFEEIKFRVTDITAVDREELIKIFNEVKIINNNIFIKYNRTVRKPIDILNYMIPRHKVEDYSIKEVKIEDIICKIYNK